jgi:hypothetical protein
VKVWLEYCFYFSIPFYASEIRKPWEEVKEKMKEIIFILLMMIFYMSPEGRCTP